MTYLRSFFLNFLAVFFIDRVSPGIQIIYFEQVPDIGADLLFSILVGFLNASVYPLLTLLESRITQIKMALMTFVVSFGAFGVISAISFGVQVTSPAGFFIGSLVIWIVAYISNYLEWQSANGP